MTTLRRRVRARSITTTLIPMVPLLFWCRERVEGRSAEAEVQLERARSEGGACADTMRAEGCVAPWCELTSAQLCVFGTAPPHPRAPARGTITRGDLHGDLINRLDPGAYVDLEIFGG